MEKIKEFLNRDNIIAVIGVSTNPGKWGWKVYQKLKSAGFSVYAINPKHKRISNDACYPNLQASPKKPDVVVTIVHPKITEKIVKQCKDLKIDKIWMQPGSESKKAIIFCKNNNIKVIANACFVVDSFDKNIGG